MKAKFWGVRANISTPGRLTEKIGGNTICLELRDQYDRIMVVDAGNGLYWLGRQLLASDLGKGRGEAALLFSHTHWDRIQGFPFFVPVFIPGNKIRILAGCETEASLENILEGQMQPEYSPIASLQNLGASLDFLTLEEGKPVDVFGFSVTLGNLPNTSQETSAIFRIEEDGRSLVYMVDIDYASDEVFDSAVAFAQDANVLIHEAFYTNDEERFNFERHATFRQATNLAHKANIERLYYFYHHPDHSDDIVEAAVHDERSELAKRDPSSQLTVDTAREGLEFDI